MRKPKIDTRPRKTSRRWGSTIARAKLKICKHWMDVVQWEPVAISKCKHCGETVTLSIPLTPNICRKD